MKTERMGLIAVAIMLLALLLAGAVRGCGHAPEQSREVARARQTQIADSAADTIVTPAKAHKRTHKKSKKAKQPVTPHRRSHLDEDT